MKTLLISVLIQTVMAITSCAARHDTNDSEVASQLPRQGIPNRGQGALCGGIGNITCPPGLECVKKTNGPDAHGSCQPYGRPSPTRPVIVESSTGQQCGGLAGKICPEGLFCYKTKNGPDASGVCVSLDYANRDFSQNSGIFCGGIGNVKCPLGTECQIPRDRPDAGGICAPITP